MVKLIDWVLNAESEVMLKVIFLNSFSLQMRKLKSNVAKWFNMQTDMKIHLYWYTLHIYYNF